MSVDKSLRPLLYVNELPGKPQKYMNAMAYPETLGLSVFYQQATKPENVDKAWKGGEFNYTPVPCGDTHPNVPLSDIGFRLPTFKEIEAEFGTFNSWAAYSFSVLLNPLFSYEVPFVFDGLRLSDQGIGNSLSLDGKGFVTCDVDGLYLNTRTLSLTRGNNPKVPRESCLANAPWKVLKNSRTEELKVVKSRGAQGRRVFTDPVSVSGYVSGADMNPDYITVAERVVHMMNLGNALYWTKTTGNLTRESLAEVVASYWDRLDLSPRAEKVDPLQGAKMYLQEVFDARRPNDMGLWFAPLPDGRKKNRVILGGVEVELLKEWAS